MPQDTNLTRSLRALLDDQRTAALGTLSDRGTPFVSMVPFAVDRTARTLVLHVSALAPHTAYLQREPRISLLVCQNETPGQPVHALPRVTLEATADLLEPDHPAAAQCRLAYLQRFPEAAPMTSLGDFRFVRLNMLGARQVAGFGAARSLDADQLRHALG